MKIEFDRYSLTIDGKREFVWSGALHYFRLPVVDQWRSSLRKMKKAGMNAVDIYFPWNYHSEAEGQYNFSGNRNVDLLMDIIEEEGLYLIARPGPYICSEVDGGGLPGWLIAREDVVLRCRDGATIKYDQKYIDYVQQWWEQITPKIAKRNNLILFQIENEFNLGPHLAGVLKNIVTAIRKKDPNFLFKLSNADLFKIITAKVLPRVTGEKPGQVSENPYVKALYDMTRSMGVSVPLFHNDIMSTAGRVNEVDMMSIDDYAITDFTSEWRNKKMPFSNACIMEYGHDCYRPNEPIFIAEYQGGWFDSWGGYGYDRIRKILTHEQLDLATKTALSQRATIINYFMFCGGTAYGYLPSPDVYTSFDYGAPIGEWGQVTQRCDTITWHIEEVKKLGDDFLATEVDESVKCTPSRIYCKARRGNSGKLYVFLRNDGGPDAICSVSGIKNRISLKKTEMKIVVVDNAGNLEKEIGKYDPSTNKRPDIAKIKLPELRDWTVCDVSPQIAADYDDCGWRALSGTERYDFAGIGNYYGYGWYRGTYSGKMSRMLLDARHCCSVWVNGKLVASKDNFRNTSGVGDDIAETFDIKIPDSYQTGEKNVVTVLVESLGFNKDFECDAKNPRGIVSVRCFGVDVAWRFRGGLIDGEKGLTPVLEKGMFEAYGGKKPVVLPYTLGVAEEGVAMFETTVTLDVADPDNTPLAIKLDDSYSKANIYVNGWLMGRYWKEMGPQTSFFIPWGILDPKGRNHIAITIWRRFEKGNLGRVTLEQLPMNM